MNLLWHLLPSTSQHDIISNVILWVIGIVSTWLLLQIKNRIKSQELRDLADDGSEFVTDFLEDAVKGGLTPTTGNLPAIEALLVKQYRAQAPKMTKDAKAAIVAIIHHELAVQTGNHATLIPPGLNVTTAAAPKPADASPLAGAAKTAGMVGLLLLPALLGIALAALLVASGLARGETVGLVDRRQAVAGQESEVASSTHPEIVDRSRVRRNVPLPVAQIPFAASPATALAHEGPAQTVPEAAVLAAAERLVLKSTVDQIAPDILDHWELVILSPGLRFNLSGTAPGTITAGSGVGFDYLFAKLMFTPPNSPIDPATDRPKQLPWFGVSFFAQGSLNISTILTETENVAVGAGVIVLDSVTLGWVIDIVNVANKSGVQATGLATGRLSLENTGPVIFYSTPIYLL